MTFHVAILYSDSTVPFVNFIGVLRATMRQLFKLASIVKQHHDVECPLRRESNNSRRDYMFCKHFKKTACNKKIYMYKGCRHYNKANKLCLMGMQKSRSLFSLETHPR